MDNKKIIGTRINEALALRNIKQKELARALNVTDNTVSYFCSGARTPSILQLIEISNYLNVSADFLLGLSKTKTLNATTKEIMEYTGLSEDVLFALYSWSHIEEIIDDTADALPDTPKAIVDIARSTYNPTQLGAQVIDIINRLIREIVAAPKTLCRHFNNFICYWYQFEEYMAKDPIPKRNGGVAAETIEQIQRLGFEVMSANDAAKWHISQFFSILESYVSGTVREEARIEAEKEAQNGTHREEHP